MKKYRKYGTLEGNVDVPLHGAPFILGNVPTEPNGTHAALAALTGPWTLSLT